MSQEVCIDKDYIDSLLQEARSTPQSNIDAALDKAERFEGLNHQEIAALLVTENPDHLKRIFSIAFNIKKHIYGNRIVLFAPLYLSDYCVNRCTYCAFNTSRDYPRHSLTQEQVREEVRILEAMGHKRLALEAGEDNTQCPIEYVVECIHTVYDLKFENGSIRRVNVNIAATTVEHYRKLFEAGIGTYILFQETYHQPTYEAVHIAGPKRDFAYHLTAFDRAHEAGIDDVGGGVLFGLADPLFEVLGLMIHNEHLEERFGVGFHTISVPRLVSSKGVDLGQFPHLVDDATFEKIVAIIRIAVPFTGMILSTRENHAMRKQLLQLGISQISAGSTTDVGGYAKRVQNETLNPQFYVNDGRNALETIRELMDDGYIPSFCTACYRSGRTGDRFMSLAKSGKIRNVCLPNALMTLAEYAEDYGDSAFKQKAAAAIEREISDIAHERIQNITVQNIEKIRHGARDFYI
ncbi:MAG: [FeFe] hydrogenase H-cluster radical SAM maturase HydG [Treponema sp.]|jgi:2-iminoacetate synthase|nr:[FeFe] hydrogenase H-cluster radical SAM maturase HydG [Treponema sp.]